MTRAGRGGGEDTSPGRHYWWWLAACAVSLMGNQALSFAISWTATEVSGTFGGLALFALVLPRVVLATSGGALADRWGAGPALRRFSLASAVTILALTALAATGPLSATTTVLVVAILVGVVDGFYRPATASYPAAVVSGAALPRALAARQTVNQGAQFAGPSVGGLLVLAGLAGGLGAALAGYLAMWVAMLWLRPREREQPRQARGEATGPIEAYRVVLGRPRLRGLALLVVGVAGFVMPVVMVLIPLTARENGWSSASAGLATGGFGLGFALVAVLTTVSSRVAGLPVRPPAGLVLAGVGIALIALARDPALGVAGAVVVGIGTGVFGTKSAPQIVAASPPDRIASVQGVLLVAQSLPYMLMSPVWGAGSDLFGADLALLGCAAGTAACGALGCRARPDAPEHRS